MMVWRRALPCARRLPLFVNKIQRKSSSRFRFPPRRLAMNIAWELMTSSAPRSLSPLWESACGIAISPKRLMMKCASYLLMQPCGTRLNPIVAKWLIQSEVVMAIAEQNLIHDSIERISRPLTGETTDYDQLLRLVGDARFC